MPLDAKTRQQLSLASQYFRSGRDAMAQALLQQLVERDAKLAPAWELLAYIAGNRGQDAQCESLLRRATALPGCSAEAFFYLGRVLLQTGQPGDAVAAFKKAVSMAGPFFEGLHELGVAHSQLGEHQLALDSFGAAARQQPRSAQAQFNLGRSLEALHRFGEALAHYDAALRIEPSFTDAWANRAVTLTELGRRDEALVSYERALALQPDDARTLMNKANTLADLHRHGEALHSLEAAARLAPETPYLQGSLLHARMHACQWSGLEEQVEELVARIGRGEQASVPFAMLATPASAGVLLQCARIYAHDKHPAMPAPVFAPRSGAAKIRLGYFSADFHNHATSHLMARLFECHERSRFELVAFAFGQQVRDDMRARLVAAFDQFHEVSERSDADIAALARSIGIDIAIDLKGFTQHARPGIFAHRAAPLQLNYLGYPGSMGCAYIDYVLADSTLVGEDDLRDYSEKVLLLPDSYQPNDDTRRIAADTPGREVHGLPSTGFVFACFNNSFKITPDVFDAWMRLLAQVPGSVLWLLKGSEASCANLQARARLRGIDASRLVWAERMEPAEHLARHAHADLFLDTLHYNAHTTCSDALWAGLPVLTLAGRTFASRVGASLLKAAGLPELVTQDLPGYEALALALAASPQRLAELRQRLARERARLPLFDSTRFARRLERGYEAIWQRHAQGLPPAHLRVGDDFARELTCA